jgi:hypothetical protein
MSTIRANTIVNMDGVTAVTLTRQWASKAWVNFVGSSASTSASGNISSVTRNGTGDWTVNFSAALVDSSYAFSGGVQYNNTGSRTFQNIVFLMWDGSGHVASTSIRFSTGVLSVSTTYDTAITTVTIVR